jgi:hypothetical protein
MIPKAQVYIYQIQDSSILDAHLAKWDKVNYKTVTYSTFLPNEVKHPEDVYSYLEQLDVSFRSLVVGDILHFNERWYRVEQDGFSVGCPIFDIIKVGGSLTQRVLTGFEV